MTRDGSHSVGISGTDTTYHSRHGAMQESLHIFIQAGLSPLLTKKMRLRIFEMGLGTGLNALLTLAACREANQAVYYETIETHPLEQEIISALNYCRQLNQPALQESFDRIHACVWEEETMIDSLFCLKKNRIGLLEHRLEGEFDLVYFDAFAPGDQPELWTAEVFAKLYSAMSDQGVLVTYSSKGSVQRNLRSAGFSLLKLPGPPGKREILKASKHGPHDAG